MLEVILRLRWQQIFNLTVLYIVASLTSLTPTVQVRDFWCICRSKTMKAVLVAKYAFIYLFPIRCDVNPHQRLSLRDKVTPDLCIVLSFPAINVTSRWLIPIYLLLLMLSGGLLHARVKYFPSLSNSLVLSKPLCPHLMNCVFFSLEGGIWVTRGQ